MKKTLESPLGVENYIATLSLSPVTESDGTFVNFEGKAQRFEMAYWPAGDSKPHWWLAAAVGRALGQPRLAFQNAREVHLALAPRLGDALGGYAFDSMPSIAKRPGIVPLAAGTVDGRLPGYRDRTDPGITEDYRRTLPVVRGETP